MEERKNVCGVLSAGDIYQELSEIKQIQEDVPYVLTLVTNTCSGIYTLVCC